MAKPITDKIAALRARQTELAAQLNALTAKAKVEDRKRDTRRKIVIGGAILAAIETDTTLADTLRRVLAANVTREMDREVVSDFLPGEKTKPSGKPNGGTGKPSKAA
jgi:hypothetical protein